MAPNDPARPLPAADDLVNLADASRLAHRDPAHHVHAGHVEDPLGLSLAQAAERLGVARHVLREFVYVGGLQPIGRGGQNGRGYRFRAEDVDAVPSEWRARHSITGISLTAAAKALRISVTELRDLTNSGRVPHTRTDGGIFRYELPELLTAWPPP